ncbi:MAG: exo-alpha-sialidase [Chloroflexi bacterium]|nr:exo-alpha-sialidase [Chloroflexota bacterium]
MTRVEPIQIAQARAGLLAPDFVVVAESPDPERIYLGSPALAKLPGGRLVATYDTFGKAMPREQWRCHVAVSDDDGRTWRETGTVENFWASPYVSAGYRAGMYLIGCRGSYADAVICYSPEGERWSAPATLLVGRYATAPTPLVVRQGRLYKAMEERSAGGFRVGFRPLLLSAAIDDDLMDATVWSSTPPLGYPGDPDKFRFGLYHPGSEPPWPAESGSWLEGNPMLVRAQVKVVLRVESGGIPNVAAVCTLVGDSPGNQRLEFESFVPWPGGQCKFFVLQDTAGADALQSGGYYWMAANAVTDHLQDPRPLAARGFAGVRPSNERRILNLCYSLDAYNWFSAGTVAMSKDPLEAFNYPSLLVDGAELLVLSRTSLGGKNQHDTSLITLHRIPAFRSLALDLRPRLRKHGE